MADISDLFWQASLQEVKQGYVYQEASDEYICLICGKSIMRGVIYPEGDQLYEAGKYINLHIEKEHKSAFHFLLSLDKKFTGLTDHQKALLELFYAGKSDGDVAQTLGAGSTSTIRNHRFSLRERQKQAKIFLALMELLGEQVPKKQSFIDIPRTSTHVDDRFAITEKENEKILKAYFKQGPKGPLDTFPLKEKRRIIIIRHLAKSFETGRQYSEKEVNTILNGFYNDYAVLRRYLIEYGFMDRTPDGSAYWVKV